MDRTALAQALNGGYIERYDVDLRQNLITMHVHTIEHGVLAMYGLRFERVSSFMYQSESTRGSTEDRLQVTELYLDETPESSPSEEWKVTISMWDTTHLSIRCPSILVDGKALR